MISNKYWQDIPMSMPEIPPGLALLLQPGPGCGVESREGQDIHPGETITCTWVNEYRVAPPTS